MIRGNAEISAIALGTAFRRWLELIWRSYSGFSKSPSRGRGVFASSGRFAEEL